MLLLDVTPLTLGDRDPRRRRHADDPAQHHHPDEEVAGVLHRQRQPALGRDRRHAGRAPHVARQQGARHLPARRHSAGAARRCRRSRSLSTSTPTASCTSPPRISAPAASRRSPSGFVRPLEGRGREDDQGGRVPRRGGQETRASRSRRATSSTRSSTSSRRRSRTPATRFRPT